MLLCSNTHFNLTLFTLLHTFAMSETEMQMKTTQTTGIELMKVRNQNVIVFMLMSTLMLPLKHGSWSACTSREAGREKSQRFRRCKWEEGCKSKHFVSEYLCPGSSSTPLALFFLNGLHLERRLSLGPYALFFFFFPHIKCIYTYIYIYRCSAGPELGDKMCEKRAVGFGAACRGEQPK